MSDNANDPIMPAIPWYRSGVMISQVSASVSALVAVMPKSAALQSLGLTNPDVVSQDVTTVFGAIALVASVAGAITRARSRVQPLTTSQLSADLHPNTLASKSGSTLSSIK